MELVNLALQKKPLVINRKRGHDIVEVKPRIWWKATAGGSVFTQIFFNRVALDIDGRGTSIEVSALDKLPDAYRVVVETVEAGELDRAMESVSILKNA